MKISYLRRACGVTRWEGESNENMCERRSTGPCVNGEKCEVVEWMKRNTLAWFSYIERKKREEFVKKSVCY